MFNLKIEDYFKLIFAISLISLIFAYFIEYSLGHQPCNLCLLERIPYALSMIFIIINLFLNKKHKFFILLLTLFFIFSFLISTYHFGIEQGYFKESTICGLKNSSEIISKEEILKQLSEKVVSCKDVTFRFFGLSLTSINMLISLIIIVLSINIFNKYGKIK